MNSLENARNDIREIDRQMAELFVRRMNAAKAVAEYKKERGLPVLDKQQEDRVIERNCGYIEDPELREFYVRFIRDTMAVSRRYQHRIIDGIKVAYNETEGAFAHIAAKRIFPGSELIPCASFDEAYTAVADGKCDCAVLPMENSYSGEVGQVIDLMFSGSLYVNAVYDLSISQNLLGTAESSISDIRTVISHTQALDHDINENNTNTTRFAVFSRAGNDVSENRDNSTFLLMFTVSNSAGAFGKAISVIGEYGFNMKALRSRPMKALPWQYYFYVEAEGDETSENGKKMLEALSKQCAMLKVVGRYSSETVLQEDDAL